MLKTTLLLFVIILAPAGFAKAEQPASNPETELLAIEMKRSEAIAAHNTAFLTDLYADDFHGVTATGYEVNKERLMEVFKRDSPSTKFALDRLHARILGETAIVTGRLVGKDVPSGKTVHESRYIHVYQKRDGAWRIIAGQGTMLQK